LDCISRAGACFKLAVRRSVSSTGYGLAAFTSVKCTRCGSLQKVGGNGSGFCSTCDNHQKIFTAKDKTKALVLAVRPIAFPAEWIE